MPYLSILIVAGFAVFFYRAAEFENESRLLRCGLSLLISITTMFFLRWGWLGVVLGQVGLFCGHHCLRPGQTTARHRLRRFYVGKNARLR